MWGWRQDVGGCRGKAINIELSTPCVHPLNTCLTPHAFVCIPIDTFQQVQYQPLKQEKVHSYSKMFAPLSLHKAPIICSQFCFSIKRIRTRLNKWDLRSDLTYKLYRQKMKLSNKLESTRQSCPPMLPGTTREELQLSPWQYYWLFYIDLKVLLSVQC